MRVRRLKRLSGPAGDDEEAEEEEEEDEEEVDELGSCWDGEPAKAGGLARSPREALMAGCMDSWELRMRDEGSGRGTPYMSSSSSVRRCGWRSVASVTEERD